MATKNYLSLQRLQEYDALLKAKIAADDSKVYEDAVKYVDDAIAGVVAGNVSNAAHADVADKLSAERTIALSGDVSGSVAFDGSKDVTIEVTVADDSHAHVMANIDGLDEALAGKSDSDHNHNDDYYAKNLGEQVAADLSTLSGVVDTKAAQTALEAETKRATEAEAGLQGQINLIMNNPDTDKVIDSIAEFTTWIDEHGEIAEGMRQDIDNKSDKDHKHTVADVTDLTATAAELNYMAGVTSGVQGQLDAKVAKETGKSLVADTEIARLAGMSDGANKVEASTNGHIKIDGVDTVVYTHPDKHTSGDISDFATAVAAVKVTNAVNADVATKAMQDGNGKVIADTYAEKATTLAGYGIGDAYTKTETDTAISNAIIAYDETWEEVKASDVTALFN